MNPKEPVDLDDIVRELMGRFPDLPANFAEAERMLARGVAEYNARPQEDLGGLSPDRLQDLLSGDWLEAGPLRLNQRLTIDDVRDSALFVDARTLLQYVAASGPLAETKSKYLTRATVAALVPRLRLLASDREANVTLRNEADYLWLPLLRETLMEAGLLGRRKGIRILPRGRAMSSDERAGELYALLFHTLFWRMDLRYLTRTDANVGLQRSAAYTFYRLRTEAREWSSSERLSRSAWLVTVKDPPRFDNPAGDARLEEYEFRGRILEPLAELGLLERRTLKGDKPWRDRSEFRLTPLYEKFIRFEW